MNRRALLAATAAGSSTIGIFGFIGLYGYGTMGRQDPDGDFLQAGWEDDDLPASVDPYIPGIYTDFPVNMNRAFLHEEVDVGSREGVDDAYRPHPVRIINALDGFPGGPIFFESPIIIGVRVIDTLNQSVVYAQAHEIPTEGILRLTLLKPSAYVVEVRTPDAIKLVGVPCGYFDCSSNAGHIVIVETDEFLVSGDDSAKACPSFQC